MTFPGRTTYALLKGVVTVDTDEFADADLDTFIDVANELVTEMCTGTINGPAVAYTAARLVDIETWLAAHFYGQDAVFAISEKAGPVSQKLESVIELGFNNTRQGQMAMRLDTNGALAALNRRILAGGTKATGFWLGTEAT